MTAPTSSPKLQLLLPHPVQARRLRRFLYGLLLATTTFALLLLTAYFYVRALTPAMVRWSVLLVGGLLVGSWGYRRGRRIWPELATRVRSLLQRFFRAAHGLSLLLALPVIRLVYLLALETERSLSELLLAHRWVLVLIGFLCLLLLLRTTAGNALDRLFFRRARQQEQLFLLLLEEINAAPDLRSAAQKTIHLLNELWQPQQIRLLFQEATLCDFHFSADEAITPTHLPPGFPLASLVAPSGGASLTAADTAWLVSLQAALLVPMMGTNNQAVGVLTLGNKPAAQPYTRAEQQYLLAVAQSLAGLSERAQGKRNIAPEAQSQLARLARLEAELRNRTVTPEEEHDDDQLLVQEHLNDLPQRQEFPARVG